MRGVTGRSAAVNKSSSVILRFNTFDNESTQPDGWGIRLILVHVRFLSLLGFDNLVLLGA